MRKNKASDMTPFDTAQRPCRQNPLLMPLIWTASRIMTLGRLKIRKLGIKKLRPPFLVLSVHQSFQDYYITPYSLFPRRANYVSDIEGFANYGKWLYRQIGCMAVRKYTRDTALIRNIQYAVNDKRIVVIFPEARHSIVGTNTKLPDSVGKLVKRLKIPVVVQKLNGSYLAQPAWDEFHSRKVPMRCTLEKVFDAAEIETLSAAEITACLNEHFRYDEYNWQYTQKIRIGYKKRAEGLHRALYLCPSCGAEKMGSRESILFCRACGKEWTMDEFGRLSAADGGTGFSHIPDWYEYQRGILETQILKPGYALDLGVTVKAIPNEKGFVSLGEGRLLHRADGFELTFEDGKKTLLFQTAALPSVHIEYNFHGTGDCIVLSTRNCCYYLYPHENEPSVTRIMLAGEILYDRLACQQRYPESQQTACEIQAPDDE